jgi:hypothetical protein
VSPPLTSCRSERALYDEVFSQPPFHWRDDESELHRERLARLLDNPRIGIATAWSAKRPIGFAYTKFRASLLEPADPALADEWLASVVRVGPECAALWARGERFLMINVLEFWPCGADVCG